METMRRILNDFIWFRFGCRNLNRRDRSLPLSLPISMSLAVQKQRNDPENCQFKTRVWSCRLKKLKEKRAFVRPVNHEFRVHSLYHFIIYCLDNRFLTIPYKHFLYYRLEKWNEMKRKEKEWKGKEKRERERI